MGFSWRCPAGVWDPGQGAKILQCHAMWPKKKKSQEKVYRNTKSMPESHGNWYSGLEEELN